MTVCWQDQMDSFTSRLRSPLTVAVVCAWLVLLVTLHVFCCPQAGEEVSPSSGMYNWFC